MTDPALPAAPFTELSNPLTEHIDALDAAGIIRTLGVVDAEVFQGWPGWEAQGLMSPPAQQAIAAFEQLVYRALHNTLVLHKKEGVVFAGCGTSGRIGFLCARACNHVLAAAGLPESFRYIVAGGDDALVLSIEAPEDSPAMGQAALQKVKQDGGVAPFDRLVVVAISCGLSAPFVAGIVDHALAHPAEYDTVVLGFNPPRLARNLPIQQWAKTCRDVFLDAAGKWLHAVTQHKHHLATAGSTGGGGGGTAVVSSVVMITPVIGGEAITGSSRMKGGTATKCIIDAVTAIALARAKPDAFQLLGFASVHTHKVADLLAELLGHLQSTINEAYAGGNVAALGAVATAMSEAVRRERRVVYAGCDAEGCAGTIGVVDASEMVDTYGCREDEWRALVHGGWAAMRNQDGNITAHHALLNIDTAQATDWLRAGDVLVLLSLPPQHGDTRETTEHLRLVAAARAVGASVFHIDVSRRGQPVGHSRRGHPDHAPCTSLELMEGPPLLAVRPEALQPTHKPAAFDSAAELALKLAANALSTAAQILRGAVYTNRMINVTVSNNKLFFRTVDMVSLFAHVDGKAAQAALLRVIYGDGAVPAEAPGDVVADPTTGASMPSVAAVARHVAAATSKRFVLPMAVILARGRAATAVEAAALLGQFPTLRAALDSDALTAAGAGAADDALIGFLPPASFQPIKVGPFTIRNATVADIPGAYHVCMKTGNYGGDGEPFYKDDPDALGRIYVGPYITFEPGLSLILEDSNGKVAGYGLGTFDTRAFFDKYEKEWRPKLAAEFPDPIVTVADIKEFTKVQQVHHCYHHPEYFFPDPYETYRSHMHIDLLEAARGQGIGRKMLEEVMRRLVARGAKGVHLGVSVMNEPAFGFYAKLGFSELCRVGEKPDGVVYLKKEMGQSKI